jgi:hypothetical protein
MAKKSKLEEKSRKNRTATNKRHDIMPAAWLALFAITHILHNLIVQQILIGSSKELKLPFICVI